MHCKRKNTLGFEDLRQTTECKLPQFLNIDYVMHDNILVVLGKIRVLPVSFYFNVAI